MEKLLSQNYFDSLLSAFICVSFFGFYTGSFLPAHSWYFFLECLILAGIVPRIIAIAKDLYHKKLGVDVIALAAVISSLITHDAVAGGVVFLMLFTGEFLEKYAGERARLSLSKLLTKAPTVASVQKENSIEIVGVNEVALGDIIVIKQGEVLPLDGVVFSGSSSLDESMITGESVFKEAQEGERVLSGSVNRGESFSMKVTTLYEESVFRGIVKLVEKAESEKAPLVKMADRYSMYFTFFTISIAVVAFFKNPHLVTAVLVVATPCPLILAAPIAFIAGMSKSARRGVIVKYGGVFESLQKVKVFIFDKTGTLTLGAPSVQNIQTFSPLYSKEKVLQIAASLEQISSHILAESVMAKAVAEKVELLAIKNAKESIGKGVSGTIDEHGFFVGNLSFMEECGVVISPVVRAEFANSHNPVVYVAKESELIGSLLFSDMVRKNAKHVLEEIRSFYKDITIVLLTGDTKERALEVGKRLGIDDVKSNCLPENKVALVTEFENNGKAVVMIGDGVNDAPSLAKASVGIALSSHGATAATDIADAVIMTDDLERIVDLISISNRTTKIAKQSMFFGITLSVIAMFAALFGYLPAPEGALLQEGIDVLMIINALRAL